MTDMPLFLEIDLAKRAGVGAERAVFFQIARGRVSGAITQKHGDAAFDVVMLGVLDHVESPKIGGVAFKQEFDRVVAEIFEHPIHDLCVAKLVLDGGGNGDSVFKSRRGNQGGVVDRQRHDLKIGRNVHCVGNDVTITRGHFRLVFNNVAGFDAVLERQFRCFVVEVFFNTCSHGVPLFRAKFLQNRLSNFIP